MFLFFFISTQFDELLTNWLVDFFVYVYIKPHFEIWNDGIQKQPNRFTCLLLNFPDISISWSIIICFKVIVSLGLFHSFHKLYFVLLFTIKIEIMRENA